MICKTSALVNSEKAQKYLETLNTKLEKIKEKTDEDLLRKLEEDEDKFKLLFRNKIYEDIRSNL